MKKLDNFVNCLAVLQSANFELAFNDQIYRTGIVGQFNLTFELAWKALQAVLRVHGANADTGSPREILQLAYKMGFLDDNAIWLTMLNRRNAAAHIYDEDRTDELVLLIRDSFIPALATLAQTLRAKLDETGE